MHTIRLGDEHNVHILNSALHLPGGGICNMNVELSLLFVQALSFVPPIALLEHRVPRIDLFVVECTDLPNV